MSILDAVLLAIVQGLTEFLPVSSSGHLVLGQHLLGINNPEILTFDVFVHFGTLISVLAVFWKDILAILRSIVHVLATRKFAEGYRTSADLRLGVAIFISAIPASLIGLFFRKEIAAAFTDPKLVAVDLVVTGLILFLTRLARPKEGKAVGPVTGFLIGVAQAIAILPGISRSGSTISAAMYLRISPVQAARFSFLMSLPVIAGASLLETKSFLQEGGSVPLIPTLVGTAVAAIVGYLAIKFMLVIVQKGKFSWFAFYCLVVGILGIILI